MNDHPRVLRRLPALLGLVLAAACSSETGPAPSPAPAMPATSPAATGAETAPAPGGAVQIDPAIGPYQKTSGVSGNLTSVGSDTMNNLMTLWAETFRKLYPNVKIQVEGKGSLHRPARPHRGHRAVRADVAADEADRDRPVREEVRLQAHRRSARPTTRSPSTSTRTTRSRS